MPRRKNWGDESEIACASGPLVDCCDGLVSLLGFCQIQPRSDELPKPECARDAISSSAGMGLSEKTAIRADFEDGLAPQLGEACRKRFPETQSARRKGIMGCARCESLGSRRKSQVAQASNSILHVSASR